MAFAKKGVKNFFNWLTNKRPKKDRLLTTFGEETEWNQEKKELIKKNKALEGQLSKIQADGRKKAIGDKDILEEIDLIKELKEKSDVIEQKKYEGLFSLNSLFLKLSKNKNFKVELTDKDDSKVFDYFKSFVVMPNGNIGIQGKSGEVWADGKTLNNIIWKPETIGTQVRRKRIQLAYDKDFQYIPDLEKLMMPEIKYDESDGEFYESEQVMRPFKEMLIERTKEIHSLLEDKAHLEKTNELFHKKIQQIEQAFKVLKQRSEIADSETTKAIGTTIDSLRAIGSISRENAVLQDENLTIRELKEKGESIIEKLMETLEDEESKISAQKAKDDWQQMFQFAQKNAPTTIINNEVQEERVETIKPGEQIGK